MQLVEKHVINKQHKFWKKCDHLALQSKHLYNSANYVQRQYFFETNQYYNSINIYHQTKNLEGNCSPQQRCGIANEATNGDGNTYSYK